MVQQSSFLIQKLMWKNHMSLGSFSRDQNQTILLTSIQHNLKLILESFSPRYDKSPMYFGINLQMTNLEIIDLIQFEEPRISIIKLERLQSHEFIIEFSINGDIYEYRT